MLKYSHKTDTTNIPNIHDFQQTIQQLNQDIKNVWKNFAENPSTEKLKKLKLLLHSGILLTLNVTRSTAMSAMPPQHYKNIPNVMKIDAKYAI